MPKCPKCQYFSFDSGDRCRNCGYEFSLAVDARVPAVDDLPMQRPNEPEGPFDDLSLGPAPNLPLFNPGGDPDAPLVSPGATPRVPLSVRRAAPTTTRPARAKREKSELPQEPRLALDTAEIPIVPPPARRRTETVVVEEAETETEAVAVAGSDVPSDAASSGARLLAGAIDLALLSTLNIVVLYFTLKILDLTFGNLTALPAAPLLAFLALLNGGYFTIFVAAGGQTLGKMATGIRVVPADPAGLTERVTFGHAIVRAVVFVASALPAGLGLLPALFGQHRGLHDRLADTRVIKA